MKELLSVLKQKVKKESIIIYMLFTLFMVIVLLNKTNYHIDEFFSYGLANSMNGISIKIVDGLKYIPTQSPWLSYMEVSKGSQFDLSHVWANQAADVHPPFYYLILHTICSIFPGKFSMWFSGSINIVFALLTLWVVRRLTYELTDNHNIVRVVSACFITSAGILSPVSFLRMYIMTLFLVSLVSLLFVLAIMQKTRTWRFYGVVVLVSYIGALTHYYFIVYLFFLCLVFGIWLLTNKKYKETIYFVFSMVLCGGLAIKTFPSMLVHMFLGGYRGEQSIENLKGSITDYLKRLGSFYGFINETLFGGFLTYAIVMFIFFLLLSKWTARGSKLITRRVGKSKPVKTQKPKEITIKWLLLIIPSICYFLLVSKMAVSIISRYLTPIYAVLMVWILCGIFITGKRFLKQEYWFIVTCLCLILMTVNSWKNCNWEYLYKNTKSLLEDVKNYSESNCLYIYDAQWKVMSSYCEVSQYNSLTFYRADNIAAIADMEYKLDKELVVYISDTCDSGAVLEFIMEQCPMLNGYQKIGSYGYATSYYLYGSSTEVSQAHIYDYEQNEVMGHLNTEYANREKANFDSIGMFI